MRIIPFEQFAFCAICGATKAAIMVRFRGRLGGRYYLDKFCRHVAVEHGLTLKDYCRGCLGIVWPQCPVTREEVGYAATGTGVVLRTYKRFAGVTAAMSARVTAAALRARQTRRGSGNPMFGKVAWNRDLPPEHPYLAKMAARRRGVVEGPETRSKQRENRQRHPLKARHTTPHTPETKRRISMHTVSMHTRRAFGRESSVHLAMRAALCSLELEFKEEYPAKFYSIDFAFPVAKVAIEADGDFFHTNPLLYPSGPMCAIQRRSARNDAAKNSYLRRRNWTVLRYWESDILAPGFIAKLRADLVRVSVLPL
jgi:very-short-patch-repair endonuclease